MLSGDMLCCGCVVVCFWDQSSQQLVKLLRIKKTMRNRRASRNLSRLAAAAAVLLPTYLRSKFWKRNLSDTLASFQNQQSKLLSETTKQAKSATYCLLVQQIFTNHSWLHGGKSWYLKWLASKSELKGLQIPDPDLQIQQARNLAVKLLFSKVCDDNATIFYSLFSVKTVFTF